MKNNVLLQLVASLVLAAIGLCLISPTHIWMSSMVRMAALVGSAAVFGALAVFVLAEGSGDERDEAHKMLAGRIAFLAGGTTLIIAIVAEGVQGSIDPWLVLALLVMVLAKTTTRLWSSKYR